MEVLRLENLSKYYTSQAGVVMGLSGVNLSFSIGEFVAVTGESGSGKSTMAHVLGGMLPYESGELYVGGHPTSHYDAADWERYRRDMIGFISQNYGILEGNTVLENISVALRLGGMESKQATARAEQLLREVDLYEMRTRRAGKLSSGQKQRLAIARALAKPSRILIADEPTGNLDRENSDKVISLLKRASRDRLVILITHEFDEAKNVATRRIELADGNVVADAALDNPRQAQESNAETPAAIKKATKQHLGGYVSALTLRARPVLSVVVCLLLAFTSFITFAVLGTFTVALDDTNTKIYSSDAFYNGDPERIVVMKPQGEAFTQADFDALLATDYVQSIELRGYANDISYYYRHDVDHHVYNDIINGPNYHPLLNPDDVIVKEALRFYESEAMYLRTFPLAQGEVLTAGRAPEGVYEVVSADPDYKIGDTIKVYLRSRAEWSASAYICAKFTVVGESDLGEGLYFSDALAATFSHASNNTGEDFKDYMHSKQIILLPYAPDSFQIKAYAKENNGFISAVPPENGRVELADGQMILGDALSTWFKTDLGQLYSLSLYADREKLTALTYYATYHSTFTGLVLVSENDYANLRDTTADNQISIYIKDYAYADRVMDDLDDMGYLSISPFRLGATKTDAALATERNTTLAVCLGAFLLILVLQILVLRAMFSSLYGHFRLLSNIGMTARSAYGALCRLLIAYTLIGEGLGAAVVGLLNACGIDRITNIFKYLENDIIALLFLAHMISVAVAFGVVLLSIKRAVFAKARKTADLEFSEEEE